MCGLPAPNVSGNFQRRPTYFHHELRHRWPRYQERVHCSLNTGIRLWHRIPCHPWWFQEARAKANPHPKGQRGSVQRKQRGRGVHSQVRRRGGERVQALGRCHSLLETALGPECNRIANAPFSSCKSP